MKKTIFTLFLLFVIVGVCHSQEYQKIDDALYICDYDYLLQQDSTEASSMVLTEMRLLIGEHNITCFQPKSNYYTDSLIQAGADFSKIWSFIRQQGVSANKLAKFRVFKDYPQKEDVYLTAYLDKTYFSVKETLGIDWELREEETIFAGFQCKKATCHFAGRDYVAWYTMEIPISEGPYKFKGLPGLIVKIADNNGQHQFELTKFTKLKKTVPIVFTVEKYVETDINGLLKVYQNDANQGIKKYKIENLSKEDEIRMNKKIRSRNNFIEKAE